MNAEKTASTDRISAMEALNEKVIIENAINFRYIGFMNRGKDLTTLATEMIDRNFSEIMPVSVKKKSRKEGGKAAERSKMLIDENAFAADIVMDICQEDMDYFSTLTPPSARSGLASVRHSHHILAQILAAGNNQTQASLLSGYSAGRISNLLNDPVFQELMAYYMTQREMIFVDVLERIKVVGLSTLDELQERLEKEPESFTNGQLKEIAEMFLVKPSLAASQISNHINSAAPTINIQFIKSSTPPPDNVIEAEFTEA